MAPTTPNTGHAWTESDVDMLVSDFAIVPDDVLAAKLGRTVKAVNRKAEELRAAGVRIHAHREPRRLSKPTTELRAWLDSLGIRHRDNDVVSDMERTERTSWLEPVSKCPVCAMHVTFTPQTRYGRDPRFSRCVSLGGDDGLEVFADLTPDLVECDPDEAVREGMTVAQVCERFATPPTEFQPMDESASAGHYTRMNPNFLQFAGA